MPDLVQAAKIYAVAAHRRIDHRRKYSRQPYEVHLKAVADLVATVSDDPAMLAAAWLHDIVEDTEVTLEEVQQEFGRNVAHLVHELSDVSRPGDGNRATRKTIDRNHLAAASARGQTIKLADLCDNALDISQADPNFARVYLREMEDLLAVLVAGHPKLLAKARRIHATCLGRLAEANPDDFVRVDAYPRDERMVQAVWRQMNAFSARDVARPLLAEQVGQVAKDGIFPDQIVDEHDSLTTVVCVLTRYQAAYVRSAGQITDQLSRSDLESAIGRMWLFGMLTLVEMDFTRRISVRWTDEQWREYLSPRRLEKAQQLQSERTRRGENVRLLDCLQLSDKASVLIQSPDQRLEWGFRTKGAAQTAIKDLELLRNQLMHSQGVVDRCWPQIARLVKRFENALSGEAEP